MSRDFQDWNNSPLHSTPPDVDRVLRAEDRRRENRRHLVAIVLVLLGIALSFWMALKFG